MLNSSEVIPWNRAFASYSLQKIIANAQSKTNVSYLTYIYYSCLHFLLNMLAYIKYHNIYLTLIANVKCTRATSAQLSNQKITKLIFINFQLAAVVPKV